MHIVEAAGLERSYRVGAVMGPAIHGIDFTIELRVQAATDVRPKEPVS